MAALPSSTWIFTFSPSVCLPANSPSAPGSPPAFTSSDHRSNLHQPPPAPHTCRRPPESGLQLSLISIQVWTPKHSPTPKSCHSAQPKAARKHLRQRPCLERAWSLLKRDRNGVMHPQPNSPLATGSQELQGYTKQIHLAESRRCCNQCMQSPCSPKPRQATIRTPDHQDLPPHSPAWHKLVCPVLPSLAESGDKELG